MAGEDIRKAEMSARKSKATWGTWGTKMEENILSVRFVVWATGHWNIDECVIVFQVLGDDVIVFGHCFPIKSPPL